MEKLIWIVLSLSSQCLKHFRTIKSVELSKEMSFSKVEEIIEPGCLIELKGDLVFEIIYE